MPSLEVFENQTQKYKNSVLPENIKYFSLRDTEEAMMITSIAL